MRVTLHHRLPTGVYFGNAVDSKINADNNQALATVKLINATVGYTSKADPKTGYVSLELEIDLEPVVIFNGIGNIDVSIVDPPMVKSKVQAMIEEAKKETEK